MKTLALKAILLFTLVVITGFTYAQKNIVIDETLEANSEPLKVKLGTQVMGKMAKYKFGEYKVLEGKVGWIKTTGSSNFFNTKAESKSTNKFSFVLTNKATNIATVYAAQNMRVKITQEVEIFAGFYAGENELLLDEQNFTATIFLDNDTTNLWLLFMNRETGSISENTGTAFLSNGERKILIISASSNKNGTDKRMFPAMGYEFIENDNSLAAMQYYGGGAFGLNKCFAWLNSNSDAETKLILSAAITALLQKEMDNITESEID